MEGTNAVHVTTEELRRASNALLDHVEATVGNSIALDYALFWSVPPEAARDVYHQPTELTVGDLSDSLAQVRAVLDGTDAPLGYGLVWLADLLRAVGASVVK